MTDTQAGVIAGRLTEAQRELLHLAATNEFAVTLNSDKIYNGWLTRCLKPYDDGGPKHAAFKITPLGLAVRAHIMENDDAN